MEEVEGGEQRAYRDDITAECHPVAVGKTVRDPEGVAAQIDHAQV